MPNKPRDTLDELLDPTPNPEEDLMSGKTEGGLDVVAQVGAFAGLLPPGMGVTDFLGLSPDGRGGTFPSAAQNWADERYVDSVLQTIGAAGDGVMMFGPVGAVIGAGMKTAAVAGRAATRIGRAAKMDELSNLPPEWRGTELNSLREAAMAERQALRTKMEDFELNNFSDDVPPEWAQQYDALTEEITGISAEIRASAAEVSAARRARGRMTPEELEVDTLRRIDRWETRIREIEDELINIRAQPATPEALEELREAVLELNQTRSKVIQARGVIEVPKLMEELRVLEGVSTDLTQVADTLVVEIEALDNTLSLVRGTIRAPHSLSDRVYKVPNSIKDIIRRPDVQTDLVEYLGAEEAARISTMDTAGTERELDDLVDALRFLNDNAGVVIDGARDRARQVIREMTVYNRMNKDPVR